MMRQQEAIGDYFGLQTCKFSQAGYNGTRKTLVYLIEELHSLKKYR